MKHECNKIPRDAPIIIESDFKSGGGWYLCIEDYGDWTHINYCPYCGMKLEDEKCNKY